MRTDKHTQVRKTGQIKDTNHQKTKAKKSHYILRTSTLTRGKVHTGNLSSTLTEVIITDIIISSLGIIIYRRHLPNKVTDANDTIPRYKSTKKVK